jgi:hypothetical protein
MLVTIRIPSSAKDDDHMRGCTLENCELLQEKYSPENLVNGMRSRFDDLSLHMLFYEQA